MSTYVLFSDAAQCGNLQTSLKRSIESAQHALSHIGLGQGDEWPGYLREAHIVPFTEFRDMRLRMWGEILDLFPEAGWARQARMGFGHFQWAMLMPSMMRYLLTSLCSAQRISTSDNEGPLFSTDTEIGVLMDQAVARLHLVTTACGPTPEFASLALAVQADWPAIDMTGPGYLPVHVAEFFKKESAS